MKFTFRGIFGFIALIALVASAVIVPRTVEYRSTRRLGTEDSVWSSDYSWEGDRDLIDRVLGLPARTEIVDISGNNDNVVEQFQCLNNLRKLNTISLHYLNSDEKVIESIQTIGLVRKLRFYQCDGRVIQRVLQKVPNIEEIEILECNNLCDEHLSGLSKCRNIQRIAISSSGVSGSFVQFLVNNAKFHDLELRSNRPISEIEVNLIANLPMLKSLYLQSNDGIPIAFTPLSNLKGLKNLTIVDFQIGSSSEQKLRNSLSSTKIEFND